jgi:DNA topoisomerase-6 subunit A
LARAKAAADPIVAKIIDSGKDIHGKIIDGRKPSMKFPLRTLSNVRYTPKKGYFEMVGKKKERTLTVSTVKTFAQTLRMVALSKQLVLTDDRATKRDACYQTKNWDDARCDDQVESDTILDDIEAFFGVNKEQLCFTPDEHGGLVDPLKDVDVKRAKAFEQLLKLGVRAEQQAFAKFDLDYVMDEYLPAKLKHPEKFLP